MATNKRDLKAYARFDGSGRIVPGSLVLRRSKPKVGKWVEVNGYECCTNYTLSTNVSAANLSASPIRIKFYCGGSIGSELLSTANWTSTNWTGNYTSGFTHTTGNTSVLSNTITATVGKSYLLTVTVTGAGAVGSVTVAFGGVSTVISTTGTKTIDIVATSATNLTITPTSTYVRTVAVSLKPTPTLAASMVTSQSGATTVANLVSGLNSTYPTLGTFSTTGSLNLTLEMTDAQKQAICSESKALTYTVTADQN
jgi:hypothetical protein